MHVPMHFAQTLEAGVIPEWKSQYVDFKQGKKLISKLEKQKNNENLAWDLPPPAMAPQNDNARHVQRIQPSYKSHNDRQKWPNTNTRLSPRFVGQSQVTNERSPLLETPASRLYTTPNHDMNQSIDTIVNTVPMQPLDPESDLSQNQRVQFFNWVNSQLNKADRYYSSMIAEAQSKLKMLERQFEHFDIHRRAHQEAKAQSTRQNKATTNFFAKLDFPTLPQVFKLTKEKDHPHPRNRHKKNIKFAHTTDFNSKNDHVSYYQAKSMLRGSLMEFFRSLLQLERFRQLNETAVRKIVKRFDKQLKHRTLDKYWDETSKLSLRSSSSLDSMIAQVEAVFAREFTGDNHKTAVDTLRIPLLKTDNTYNLPVLFSGVFLGAALPLVILGLYTALRNQNAAPEETNFLLQMFGGFSLVALAMVGFAGCLACWAHYRVNTSFILEFDPSTMLDFREFLVLPSLFALGLGLFGWLTFNTNQSFHRYYPCVYLAVTCLVLALPTVRIFGNGRRWLLHSLWRLLLSGLYSVEFRDLLMGDIMCSLTYSLSTIELFFCVYATPNWWNGEGSQHAQRCTSSHSRALGFLSCLPGIWRFLQCWRRYGDTLDWFPHLPNACKYTFTILYNMSLSLARIQPHRTVYKVVFIVFALINGVISGFWDIIMDFSLSPRMTPRAVLVYPRWTYWAVMILDFVMRQNWVLYVVFWNYKPQGAKISYIVALIEVVRRILWVTVRVENEHASNIASCRAFKDLSLPYDILPETESSSAVASSSASPLNWTSPSVGNVHPTSAGRSATFAGSLPHSPSQPTPIRRNTVSKSPSARSLTLSPRLQFAHTHDFQRRAPKKVDDEEDYDYEESD